MDRRCFIQSVAIGGCGTAFVASSGIGGADADGVPTTRRFVEQRWALDNIIRANGIDWDQPRSIYLSSPCGTEANADFAAIRTSVQKLADIGPAFENTARRREAKARAAESDGYAITARDNWYMAAIHYGAAEWPYDDAGKKHIGLHQKKRECFVNYARLADHKIEAVSIPFKDKSILAWFHLPPGYSAGKVPVVIAIPGMDSFKETGVALANDCWMLRGVAVLAIDGPGQYESPLLGVYVSMQNWIDAGPVLVDWLSRRVEIDADKIGVTGTSFGSFFGTILTANEPSPRQPLFRHATSLVATRSSRGLRQRSRSASRRCRITA